MLKWMKKKFQSKTDPKVEREQYSDIDYFLNMDETLEFRDEYYIKLTKLALGPASLVLEKYILHYFEDGVTANIKTVDRVIPNVLKLSGIASLESGEMNTFTFIIPVHLIASCVVSEDISQLVKFTNDYQKLLKVDSITEEDLINIMSIFTKNKATYLSDISEYNGALNKTEADDTMGFDGNALTEEQMKSFVRLENGALN